jgi:hypothetical protein
VKQGANCPKTLEIEYIDPETGKSETMFIPERLQTCGVGVSKAWIKQ